jgi:hypothetical protein
VTGRVKLVFVAFVLASRALAFAQPIPTMEPIDPTGLLARIEKTRCFGSCPAYVVDVSRSGVLRYDGRDCVMTKGFAVRQLGRGRVSALRRAFDHVRFRAQREHCCDCYDVTDHPSVILTLADGEPPKTIRDYHGCQSTPRALRSLERKIDRIIDVGVWVGLDPVWDARGRCSN